MRHGDCRHYSDRSSLRSCCVRPAANPDGTDADDVDDVDDDAAVRSGADLIGDRRAGQSDGRRDRSIPGTITLFRSRGGAGRGRGVGIG